VRVCSKKLCSGLQNSGETILKRNLLNRYEIRDMRLEIIDEIDELEDVLLNILIMILEDLYDNYPARTLCLN
jgi:hypothetical protein